MPLRDLKAGTRLTAAFGAVALVILLIAVLGYRSVGSVHAALATMYADRLLPAEQLGKINEARLAIYADLHRMIVAPDELAAIERNIGEQLAVADDNLRRYETTSLVADEDRGLALFKPSWESYRRAVTSAVQQAKLGSPEAVRQSVAQAGAVSVAQEEVAQILGDLIAIQLEVGAALTSGSDRVVTLARWLMVLAGVVGVVLAGLLAVVIGRSITSPLAEIAHAAHSIAVGGLGAAPRITVSAHDEIGVVASAFNVMTDELQRAEDERTSHLRFLEHLERVDQAIRTASDVDAMLTDILDTALAIFDCDRAWLLHPCDPDAPTFRIPMERTCEQYPGAFALKAELPVDPDTAEVFATARGTIEPIRYDPSTGRGIPYGERFSIRSQIILAIHPKVASPWLLGLHQCSHARVWTDDDVRLLKEVGRRVADGLSSLLVLKDLRESERRYRALAEAAREMVFEIGHGGCVEYVNTIAAEQLGRDPEEIVGRPQTDLFPAATGVRQEDAIKRVLASGKPLYTESEVPFPDHVAWLGTWLVPLRDDSGAVRSVLGVARDITQRKRAEEALAESERRFRSFVEHAMIGFYQTDPGGRVLMANPSLARVLGFASLEDLLATNLEEWGAVSGYSRAAFREALEREGSVAGFESTLTRPDGTTTHVVESARAVQDPAGSTLYYEGIIEDLTAQKALEAQLLQAQKMEAVGRLAGGVAHDFNNLLQVMLTHTQLLRGSERDPAKQAELVDELESEVKRGAALARQLLLFSRRDTVRRESLDLNQVVTGSTAMLRRLVRENISLEVDLADQPLPVEADSGQLEQVLVNLVVNATDAMPNGGRLMIRSAREGSDSVRLEVADTGHGISNGIRDRIFEPFFTTKDAGSGTGLGLAVVHGIVLRHRGRIDIESPAGEGTTVRIVLPGAEAGTIAAGTERVDSPTELADGRGERILVVEDEDGAREGLRDILAALGYEVTAVGSGEEARLLPAPTEFDVLLTDLLLPGVSGAALAAELCRRAPRLKTILMSGYAEPEDIRNSVAAGEIRFLQKPFGMAVLARVIRAALEEG